jgi:alpha-glucosidase
LAPCERNAQTAPAVNPYNHQLHLYDKSRPENLEFLKRFRAVLDEFPAIAAVGEVGDSQRGLEIAGEYTSGGDKVHMCYAFEFLAPDPLTPKFVRDTQEKFGRVASDGWACWAFSNHDVVRHISRWGAGVTDHIAHGKMLAGLLMSLRGSVCIYQGEELGLEEADLAYEDLQDPYGIQFWPDFKGRDGCRTPMVWSGTEKNGGFSDAKPWLPVPAAHLPRAVDLEEADAGSLLNHYKAFVAFRKKHPALAKGDITFEIADENVLAFTRKHGNEILLCVFNMTENKATAKLPEGDWETLDDQVFAADINERNVNLPGWGAYFARRT